MRPERCWPLAVGVIWWTGTPGRRGGRGGVLIALILARRTDTLRPNIALGLRPRPLREVHPARSLINTHFHSLSLSMSPAVATPGGFTVELCTGMTDYSNGLLARSTMG